MLSPGLPGSLGLKQAGLWLAGIPSKGADLQWHGVSPSSGYNSGSWPGRESGINGLIRLTLREIINLNSLQTQKGKNEG